jgi:uncharacterized membrane protein YtjA (UPF0391 family)
VPPPTLETELLRHFCKSLAFGTRRNAEVAAHSNREIVMLHYAVVFFVIALIAALFGFGGIAASAVGIAKILFVVFAILAIASFLFGIIKK